ncbi:MAG: acetyl-CoA hydrolase/transferase C-terminal domain-containing protein [Dehalococcoidia bacterium]
MDWRRRYKDKIIPAEDAARVIKSGDTVIISVYPQPKLLMDAIAARREELRNVHILTQSPSHDPGWFQPGWEGSFPVTVMMYLDEIGRPAYDQRLIDYHPVLFSLQWKPYEDRREDRKELDLFITVTSPPDEKGFCSFGDSLWNKRAMANEARTVIAQVDENQIRTYGTNYIHVSEIDHLVDYTPPVMSLEEATGLIRQVQDAECRAELQRILSFMSPLQRKEILPRLCESDLPATRSYARDWGWIEPPEEAKRIAEYVSEIIRDGDTIQIGQGTPGCFLPRLGVFDGKKDLGWHSEMGAQGAIRLMESGVINGSRKTVNPGVAVFTGLYGLLPEEVAYCADNPLIEQRDASYVVDIPTVAAHDNMVAINNALSVDFSGQINVETVFGARLWNGTGGQPEMHIGAVLSRGGRAITLMRSTALGGTVSRIVPKHEEGTVVTIPRTFADIIITEHGVARLLGKSIRERARELTAIAHPDFRVDLKREVAKLFYP